MSERDAFDSDKRTRWRDYVRGSALLREALNRDIEAQVGMSLDEYEVLERLAEAPDGAVRVAALADRLVHAQSRLTHTVHRMESRGLVERRAGEADGRGVYCVITPLGEQAHRLAEPGHAASVKAYLLDRVTPDELDVLGRVMARISEDLSGDAPARGGVLVERAG